MILNDYLKALKFFFNRFPPYLIFFPTSRCNASCDHCFNWQRTGQAKKTDELTVDEIRKTFKDYGHLKYVTISGGEPMLRDDIDQISRVFYQYNGVQGISLHTNGYFSDKLASVSKEIISTCPDLFLNICL